MIYKDTYQFLINDASSKEIDVCLYLLTKQDWLGIVNIDYCDIAANCNTKTRYVKSLIKKLSRPMNSALLACARKPFISPVFQFGADAYRINFGMNKLENTQANFKYMKKFSFFYTKEFQSLKISAKKLLLVAAFNVSLTNNVLQRLRFDDLVKDIPGVSKRAILDSLAEIEKGVGFKTRIVKALKKNYAEIIFPEDINSCFIEEKEESMLFEAVAFECGGEKFSSPAVIEEVLKTGKSFFNTLFKASKEEGALSLFDDLTSAMRRTYKESLYDLFSGVHKEGLSEPKEISAYLRGVLINKLPNLISTHSEEQSRIEALRETYQAKLSYFNDDNQENVTHQLQFLLEYEANECKKLNVFKNVFKQVNSHKIKSLKEEINTRNNIINSLNDSGIASNNSFKKHLTQLNESINDKITSLYKPFERLMSKINDETAIKSDFLKYVTLNSLNKIKEVIFVSDLDLSDWEKMQQENLIYQLSTDQYAFSGSYQTSITEDMFPF
ncbi:hypothetical protein [Bacillus sp. Marseille-P3800]|uniref:hypothetical protein n=1 Tax=Bacillus sp. Marseille-P3800 TaxID=2014782 RepID=UPI000C085EF0|nr:hypothetical protein [Bacillus sp. Marseille-P3800]